MDEYNYEKGKEKEMIIFQAKEKLVGTPAHANIH